VGCEGKAATPDVGEEARIVVVALRVEGACEEILVIVVLELLLLGQVTKAGLEHLRQQQQSPDPIAILREILRMRELLFMTLRS
jgi:hypothetical protein